MIVSLYAGGMTIRDIGHHLVSTIGTELVARNDSKITDAVCDEVMAWQKRPLESLYPVIYLDAIMVKVRDGGHVRNKAAHIAVGVDMDGIKHVLGIWVQATEGAKFWASVCAELANRGVRDVLIGAVTGSPGSPKRSCDLAASNRSNVCRAPHPGCDALRQLQGSQSLGCCVEADLSGRQRRRCPVRAGDVRSDSARPEVPVGGQSVPDAWERFIPFLAFPPALRPVIYTTNSIESLNYQLRKVTKNRGHFPNDLAAVKLLWLGICNIEDKRARERIKERGLPSTQRRAPGRLVEGQITTNWKQALEQLVLVYPDRINPYI